MKQKYILVARTNLLELEDAVNVLIIQDNYIPLGGVSVAGSLFVQALVYTDLSIR